MFSGKLSFRNHAPKDPRKAYADFCSIRFGTIPQVIFNIFCVGIYLRKLRTKHFDWFVSVIAKVIFKINDQEFYQTILANGPEIYMIIDLKYILIHFYHTTMKN